MQIGQAIAVPDHELCAAGVISGLTDGATWTRGD
jgi:hypothetical protein